MSPRGSNKLDLTGRQYGELLVLEQHSRSAVGASRWRCRCSCGRIVIVQLSNLQSGNSKRCRYCARPKSLNGTLSHVLAMRRHSARERGLEWTIPVELGRELLLAPCFYCGAPPFHAEKFAQERQHVYGGLDRIDSNRGYAPDNVRPCCKYCNFAKHRMSEQEFAAWCVRLIAHRWWERERP